MSNQMDILKHLYERFNARDIEGALDAMHEDVLWANGMEGGHVQGRDEIRNYWTRQWGLINPHVEPVAFYYGSEGEVVVDVHQVIRNLNGNIVSDRYVEHVFRMDNGRIKRFDIRSRGRPHG